MLEVKEITNKISLLAATFKEEGFEVSTADDLLTISGVTFNLRTDCEAFCKNEKHYIVSESHEEWLLYVMIYVAVKKTMESDILEATERYLSELGIHQNLKGFLLLADAIIVSALCKEYVYEQMAGLFHIVSVMNGTSTQRVEKNIRTAISSAYDRKTTKYHQLFGDKPTSSQFISYGSQVISASCLS